jgi:hypothetical protein
MIVRFIYSLLLLSSFAASFAQVNAVKQAQGRMENGKWPSAKQLLEKALTKDTANVESKLALARWYYAKANPSYQLDSAYRYTNAALGSFSKLSDKQKEKLQRFELANSTLIAFRIKIDSAAFEQAKQINTEKSYIDFLQKFPHAKERSAVIELRDEIGFLEALKINSWKSFKEYVSTYPESHRKEEALSRYEKLLFEERTKSNTLEAYKSFVAEFPSSRYAPLASRQIFEIATARGSADSFIQFIQDANTNRNKNEARNILFHLLLEREEKMPIQYLTDSLRDVLKSKIGFWVPFLRNGKYGFLDSLGAEAVAAKYDSIDEVYRCGGIKDDIIHTPEGLINRQGKRVGGKYSFVKDIGFGFLKVGDSSCFRLLHKSGKMIMTSCAQDYFIVGNSFVVIKVKGFYGLHTLMGRQLLPPTWESIQFIENVIVLTRLGKKTLCAPKQLAAIANGDRLPEELVFDEVRSAGPGFLLVRNGALEGILDSQLEFTFPLDRQSLFLTSYGLTRKVNSNYLVSGVSPELEKINWDRVSFYKQWLLLTRTNRQSLFDLTSKKMMVSNADSVWFDQGLAFASIEDSVRAYINSIKNISIAKDFKINFITAKDSVRYFYTEMKNKKAVFDIASGTRLFLSEFDHIESLTVNTFLIVRKNKMGLLSREGKIMLPIEYDAIVKTTNESVSIFKDKKFGLYDLRKGRLIKPLFDRNVVVLNEELLAVSKDKFYGLIGWDGKPLTPFEFDDIQSWISNVIWVKKNFYWQLMDFRTGKIVIDKVKDFRFVSNLGNEKVVLVHRENFYGIVSTIKGIIISPTFSAIVNVGTEEYPLYFTDKEVEEAGIHVVIYYDRNGKFLRKQVYEDEEFERIFCE